MYDFRTIALVLKNPNFGVYIAGNSVSLTGTWMQRVAIGWLTWELTQSPTWLGIIAFADLFPTVLIAPFAGAAADRWDRLRVVKISQALAMLQAAALFALTASGLMTIWLLLILAVFLGMVTAVHQPARLALIPLLISRAHLAVAVSITSVVFNLARFIGPALAGAIIVASGVSAAFAINAASFVFILYALSRIRTSGSEISTIQHKGMLRGFGAGVRYAFVHTGMAAMLMILIAISFGARPLVELLPGFATNVFEMGARGLAILTSSVGIGAMIAGLWLSGGAQVKRLTQVALVTTLILAVATALFVATDWLWVAVPAIAVAGFCMSCIGIAVQTLIQLSVDGAMRGRVMSLYSVIFQGGPAFGALLMGWIAEYVTLRVSVLLGTALVLAIWLWAHARRDRILQAFESGEAIS